MVDEKRPLTRQERRQRQKRLEQALRRRRENGAPGAVADEGSPTSGTAPDAEASSAAGSGHSPRREITAAGVLSDPIVQFANGKAEDRPDHRLRYVCVACSRHTSRGKYRGGSTGPGSDGVLRIATNLLDVPAEIISLIYRFRWTIELFFRFFKQILGCRKFYFRSQNGITLQAYCAILACLLPCLWTGRKPTKRTYEMVCYYFLGLAREAELLAHLDKLKQRDALQSHT